MGSDGSLVAPTVENVTSTGCVNMGGRPPRPWNALEADAGGGAAQAQVGKVFLFLN